MKKSLEPHLPHDTAESSIVGSYVTEDRSHCFEVRDLSGGILRPVVGQIRFKKPWHSQGVEVIPRNRAVEIGDQDGIEGCRQSRFYDARMSRANIEWGLFRRS